MIRVILSSQNNTSHVNYISAHRLVIHLMCPEQLVYYYVVLLFLFLTTAVKRIL